MASKTLTECPCSHYAPVCFTSPTPIATAKMNPLYANVPKSSLISMLPGRPAQLNHPQNTYYNAFLPVECWPMVPFIYNFLHNNTTKHIWSSWAASAQDLPSLEFIFE